MAYGWQIWRTCVLVLIRVWWKRRAEYIGVNPVGGKVPNCCQLYCRQVLASSALKRQMNGKGKPVHLSGINVYQNFRGLNLGIIEFFTNCLLLATAELAPRCGQLPHRRWFFQRLPGLFTAQLQAWTPVAISKFKYHAYRTNTSWIA